MNPASFADELIKLGGASTLAVRIAKMKPGIVQDTLMALRDMGHGLKHSKVHREAVLHSTLLGAGTGAISGAAAGGDTPASSRMLHGAISGGAAGAATGAVFPGWFGRSNRVV